MKYTKRSDIIELLFPSARARILRLLFNQPNKARYLSELAQRSDITFSTAHEELTSLLAAGVVTTYRSGSRRYFRPARDHRLFPHLLSLVHAVDRVPPIDVSQLRRNKRVKLKRPPRRKRPPLPLPPDTVYSGTLKGLR